MDENEEGESQEQRLGICYSQWRNRNDSMDKKLRIDSGRIDSYQYDEDEDTLTADVELTRSQVLPYRDDDGEIVRELLPPDELSEDSWLNSTKGKPVTEDHPSDPLNIDSISEHSKGTLHDKPDVKELDDDQVSVWNKVTIFNDELIDAIQGGKEQVSIGRKVDVFDESGEYKGDSYDRVQRNFRLNHLAVVDRGRAGPDVKMRLDGDLIEASGTPDDTESQSQNSQDTAKTEKDSGAGISLKTTINDTGDEPMKLTIGDKELDLEPKNDEQEDIIEDAQDKVDELMHKNKDLEDAKEDLESEIKELKDKLEEGKDKEDSEEDDDKLTQDEVKELLEDEKEDILDSIDSKVEVIHETKNVDDEYEPQYDKGLIELKKDFIERVDEGASLENKSDGYVEVKYENLLDSLKEENSRPTGENSMVADASHQRESIQDKRERARDPNFLGRE